MASKGFGERATEGGEPQPRTQGGFSGDDGSRVIGLIMRGAGAAGDWIERGIDAAIVLVLLAELVLVFVNIVLRTLFGFEFDWVQELSGLALVFLTFVGGAIAYRRGAHMRVHAGINALPARARSYVLAAVDSIVFVVALSLVQQSIQLLTSEGVQRTPMLGLPVGWMTGPVTVGMALMAMFAFGRLFSYPARVVLPAVAVVMVVLGVGFVLTEGTGDPDQALVVSLVAFALLLAMSAPVGFVFAAASLLYVQQTKMGMLTAIPLNMQYGMSSFVMLAIPFFILAGLVMTEGGLTSPMSDFIVSVIGRLRGGLLQVIVVAMYIFSGISGSKVADMVAVGSSLSTMLKREEYPKGETAAVLASAAAMGETVPPSIAMLVLGFVSSVSIISLFMAGLLPAVLIALCLMVAIYFRAGKLGVRRTPAVTCGEIVRRGITAVPAFMMPIMLLAGVLSGVSTPTEVSSLAVLYGILMGVLLYRSMTGRSLWRLGSDAASMTGNILFVVSAAAAFSGVLTLAQVPNRLAGILDVFRGETWLFMLACVVFLVIMGGVLEGLPMILVLSPILFPVVAQFGINELQFAIVMIIAMGIGLFSPPIGIGLYFACTISETTIEETTRPMLFYLVVLMIGLLLVAFIPEVSLALPRLLGLNVH